jgi:high-affinity iron transporter
VIGAALIVLREVVEAALVIGIVLAATRGVAGRGRHVAGGVALGVAGAVIVAAFADAIAGALEGVGQEVFNATVLLSATALLGWHNVWMKRHGAELAREMRTVGDDVANGRRSLAVLLLVVGLAVLREGAEVVLFLNGIAAGGAGAGSMLAGGLIGLAGGAAVGALLYFGLLSIPTRRLFGVTGALLLLLAAGMAAQAAGYLVQAGKLPALADPLWDSSAWLPQQSVVGQALHALAGYVDRPSGMQVLFFVVVAVGIGTLMRRVDRRPSRPPTPAAATGAAVVAVAAGVAFVAPRAEAAHVVYSPVLEEGEVAVELRGHHDFDSREDVDGGQQFKLDLEYTPNAWWRTELLGEWEKEPGESLEATEIAWENVFQLTPQGKYWMDLGLLAEYAHTLEDDGEDALELGLLAEKQFAATVLTANLVFEREFEGGAETEMEYAARYRWRMSQACEPGIEFYGDLGDWGDNGRASDHGHQAGPAVLGKLRAGPKSAFKYEAAVLFGLTDAAPDTTVRFLLEYEF